MRYLLVAALLVLGGCSDGPVQPVALDSYVLISLTILSEGVDATLVDLNENGQALWHEGGQPVLWDQGNALEVPAGKFLGSSGEVVGDSSVWIDGQLTELPGLTRGIAEDGTVYFSRSDTMFTWRGGPVEATDLPMGTVGPEGRIYRTVHREEGSVCEVFQNGQWNRLPALDSFCRFVMAEENGWVLLGGGAESPNGWLVTPNDSTRNPAWIGDEALAHVNSRGDAVGDGGTLFLADTTFHPADQFGLEASTVVGGAINDNGDVLLRDGRRIILLDRR